MALAGRFFIDGSGDGGLMDIVMSPTYAQDRLMYAYISTATDNRVVRVADGDVPKDILTVSIALRPVRPPMRPAKKKSAQPIMWPTTMASRRGESARAAATTWRNSARPASGWSTLGKSEFMRLP